MKVLSLIAKMGEPRYCQAQQVNYWFWERGYEVLPFSREQLLSGELDELIVGEKESTIVYGAVAVVRDALKRLSITAPCNLDFPAELSEYFGRTITPNYHPGHDGRGSPMGNSCARETAAACQTARSSKAL